MEYKVLARGDDALPCDDAAVLRDYFNAGTSLGQLAQLWAESDPRFCNVHPYFPGACCTVTMPRVRVQQWHKMQFPAAG